MTLDERIAALEAKIEAMEKARCALRNQFIGLQLVLIRALPVISASSTAQLDAAISDAKGFATDHLLAADYATEDIHAVLDAIEALREDMGDRADAGTKEA